MEFNTGILSGAILSKSGFIDVCLVLVVLLALYFDIKQGRIPNKITFSAVAFGFIFRAFTGYATGEFFQVYDAILGGLAGFVILFIPFIFGGMGAGDVKLLTAIGVLKGLEFVFYTALTMGIIGGIIAGYYYFFVKLKGAYFPYGVAISIGAIIALLVQGF